MDRISLSAPDVGDLEREYVDRALRSGWVAPLGPEVEGFEAELAELSGRDYAVALSSGTAALHLGLLALGVKPGDVVVTATMTFAATANAIVYVGAIPYFVDCDPDTGNLDPDLLEEALEELAAAGEKVGAIIPVDLLGKMADYSRICAIAKKYDIPVLADAAESVGAFHDGRPAGGFGEAAVLSFNGNKIMTTSGGGAFLTDKKELAKHVRYLATQARQPVAHYEHEDIGYNYRLSNILAALGRAQLSRLEEMLDRRRALRERYKELFAGAAGVTIFQAEGDEEDNVWLTAILVDPQVAGWGAEELRLALEAKDIESRFLWKPMHLQPVFKGSPGKITGASQELFETGLSLPSGSALTDRQIRRVLHAITRFLEEVPR